ncbi:aspartyl-phosphate phosphatase Spo0E family protein [Metabacillus malikii]|uniref:Stage 0 sporulation regulatory protein n=1 Tax=Metabacillus malikii TaxID=1504265 RepID=A0ABT9ZD17_9BACI|nr:aspartyl-phosphate phosphatase Spo0E family protein [Metabacillus malikii]MDQ0229473.1 stage 0 sporulation regulatory protein [Metabacillus malikii]
MKNERLSSKLFELIQVKRQEMIETARKEGLTSQITVKVSQDLDYLLNIYEKLLKEEECKDGLYDFFLKRWTTCYG